MKPLILVGLCSCAALTLSSSFALCHAGVLVIPSTAAKGSSSVTSTPGPTDAIAWYKFDNDLSDASGTGNGLTGVNGPTFTTGQDSVATHALSLDGSTQNAIKSSPASLPTGDVSFSAWIYPTSSTGSHTICCLGLSSLGTRQDFYFELENLSLAAFQFQGPTFYNTSGGFNVTQNAWNQVALVYTASSGALTIYFNGGVAYTDTLGSGFPSGINTISVGAFVDANGAYLNWFQGNIDDVRIFARTLTGTEVANLYASNAAFYRARPDYYLAFEAHP